MNNLTHLEHNALEDFLNKTPITLENDDLCVVKDLMVNQGGVFYPDTWNDETEKYNYSHLMTMTQLAKLCIEEYEKHKDGYDSEIESIKIETLNKIAECEALLEVTANQE